MIHKGAARLSRFFSYDIWRLQFDDPGSARAVAIQYLRVLSYAVRGFHQDNCYLRASALTFYSLLSFVPVVAMAFAVAKGFGFRKLMEKSLMEKFPGHEAILQKVISSANSFLDSAKSELIAGVGIVLLFWTVIKVLAHVESAFNDIWHIRKARSMGRKSSDYLSMMMICPVLFIMSSSFAIFITTQIRTVTDKIQLLGMVAPIIFFALDYSPYLIIWVLFTFSYLFMPNTKVRFDAALLAGIIAGTAFQLAQYGYLHFQVGVTQYNAIYGSFAALPLFCIWMQVSWLVVLFGAEFSHAHQQMLADGFKTPDIHISVSQKRLIALQLTHFIIKRFELAEPPPKIKQIAVHLQISITVAEKVLRTLCKARLISAIEMNGTEGSGYQPGQDISRLTIYRIIEAMDNQGACPTDFSATPGYERLTQTLVALNEIIKSSPANQCLKDL
jgi:membrane protein